MLLLQLAIPALVFALVALMALLLLTPKKAAIRARIEGYAPAAEVAGYEAQLTVPLFDRIVLPFLQQLAGLVRRVTPEALAQETAGKLAQAGQVQRLGLGAFYVAKVVLGLMLPGAYALQVFRTGAPSGLQLGLMALLAYAGYRLPDWWLNGRINQRRTAIARVLPDALDLLVVCVEAGLSFEASLSRVVERNRGPLADEFRRTLAEMSLGKRRRDALRDMAERCRVPEMSSFVAMVVQADQTGVSTGDVLRVQADVLRVRRQQRAQEEGHRAPLKMLAPLIFFILPATFVVILGPAALNVADNFSTFAGGSR